MSASTGTVIEFPLAGKFRAFGVKIALSSDAPPHATASVHVLVNGRQVANSPPFKAGDPPRFMEINLQNSKSVTLMADSMFPGVRVLFIDPVAIRDTSP